MARALLALTLAIILHTTSAALNASRCIEVRDYGARGDGVTDDSDAIQAAVHVASKPRHPKNNLFQGTFLSDQVVIAVAGQKDFMVENTLTHVRQHNVVGGPDLCFSPGDYRVTRTIGACTTTPTGPHHNLIPRKTSERFL